MVFVFEKADLNEKTAWHFSRVEASSVIARFAAVSRKPNGANASRVLANCQKIVEEMAKEHVVYR